KCAIGKIETPPGRSWGPDTAQDPPFEASRCASEDQFAPFDDIYRQPPGQHFATKIYRDRRSERTTTNPANVRGHRTSRYENNEPSDTSDSFASRSTAGIQAEYHCPPQSAQFEHLRFTS